MRFFFCFLLLFAAPNLSAQTADDYTPIAERLAAYARQTMDWEIDSLLDLTDPELFEVIPRQAMRAQLAGLSSDEDMEVTFKDFTIDDIGEIVNYREDGFAPIKCHHRIEFRMRSDKCRAKDFQDRMARMLQKSYGKDRVRHNPEQGLITVNVVKSMFAIRRGKAAKWCFVEYRPENAALMDLLLPPVVREQVGLD